MANDCLPPNPEADKDQLLFQRLGIEPLQHDGYGDDAHEAVIEDALETGVITVN